MKNYNHETECEYCGEDLRGLMTDCKCPKGVNGEPQPPQSEEKRQ